MTEVDGERAPVHRRALEWLTRAQDVVRDRALKTARWLDPNIAPLMLVLGIVCAWVFRGAQIVHVPDYLAAIVGLETTAVAIMVPVALDVAFRVYEEYRSRIVRSYLLQERRLTRLVVITFLNAVATVLAHAIYSWSPESPAFVPVSVFATVEAVGVVITLLAYLRYLRDRVLSEPDWLIDQLADDAMRELSEGGAQ